MSTITPEENGYVRQQLNVMQYFINGLNQQLQNNNITRGTVVAFTQEIKNITDSVITQLTTDNIQQPPQGGKSRKLNKKMKNRKTMRKRKQKRSSK